MSLPGFVPLAGWQQLKRRIREAAEIEERECYEHRAPAEWLEALAPLGTGPEKPFLETAPVLIAVFVESCGVLPAAEEQRTITRQNRSASRPPSSLPRCITVVS